MAAVPQVNTRWTTDVLLKHVAEQLSMRMNAWPSQQLLAIFWAKCTTECGRNGKSCWNYNAGNVRGNFKGQFFILKNAYEKRPDGTIYYPENQQFRAYENFAEGVGDMLDRLSRQKNFALAWEVLMSANPTPQAYVHAAKLGKYFTEDEAIYAKCVTGCYSEAIKFPHDVWPVAPDVFPPPTVPPTERDSDIPWAPKTAEQFLRELEERDDKKIV